MTTIAEALETLAKRTKSPSFTLIALSKEYEQSEMETIKALETFRATHPGVIQRALHV